MTSHGPEAMTLSKDIHKKEIMFPDIFARIVTEKSIMPPELKDKFGENVPYDVYLPSQQDNVQKRICPNCQKYHSSIKSLTIHKRVCKKPGRKEASKITKAAPAARRKTVVKEREALIDGDSEDSEESVDSADITELEEGGDAVNASFEDYEDNNGDEVEEIQVGEKVGHIIC